MPELPEVETVRRGLEAALDGARVVDAVVHRRDVVRGPRRKTALLVGAQGVRALRHGKQIAIADPRGPALCIHLGMTGAVLHLKRGARTEQRDHVHVTWRLDGPQGSARLLFRDPRRFGGVWAYPSLEALQSERWRRLGPDAATVTGADLASPLAASARPIKAALLDQNTVAGVGNIYADEALHAAGVRPDRRCNTLTRMDFDRIAAALRAVLARAIDAGGSTIRDYRAATSVPGSFQRSHAVYGRAGMPCLTCARPLTRSLVAQRTTVHCPACQR